MNFFFYLIIFQLLLFKYSHPIIMLSCSRSIPSTYSSIFEPIQPIKRSNRCYLIFIWIIFFWIPICLYFSLRTFGYFIKIIDNFYSFLTSNFCKISHIIIFIIILIIRIDLLMQIIFPQRILKIFNLGSKLILNNLILVIMAISL